MDAFRFLHSSDLHLGRAFGGYPEGIRHRLRGARHDVIARLGKAARTQGARTVLLAGDTFDAETPAPATLRHALQAMREESDLTWFILPGNHDSLAASELWRRIAQDAPTNLYAITNNTPVELSPGNWLLPAPCTHRRSGLDLTEAMSTPTQEGVRRIGLGHGAITDFSGEEVATGIIPPDRAARSGLHYLALGDWHGKMQVAPTTWYSGTPEPDGFKHDVPGTALSVTLDGLAKVTPVETGQFRWTRPTLDVLPGEDIVARIADAMPTVRARDHLVRLVVTGRLPLAKKTALEADLEAREPDFGWFEADLDGLSVEALPEDLDEIDRAGALRQAAEGLMSESLNPGLNQSDRDIASAALARLYAITQELRA